MRELSALLERFPDVAVIWAHGGYTPLFVARRMLERHPNLTYELSARTWPSIRARPTTRSCATARRSGPSGWR
jgi:predicted TIM-barrel fold metal-dependent hydrolase